MSRMERIRGALAATIAKQSMEIEAIHKKGHFPPDYSLGFVNALIFVDHQINHRFGEPKFYNRTTSIGQIPKPIALKTDQEQIEEAEQHQLYEDHIDKIIMAAKEACLTAPSPLQKLEIALNELEEFVNKQVEGVSNDKKTEAVQQEMGFIKNQESRHRPSNEVGSGDYGTEIGNGKVEQLASGNSG